MPRKNPETKFKEKVQNDLKTLKNCYFVKIQQVAINGTPDILASINGHFVALELKKDIDADISKLQTYNIKKIKQSGGIAYAVIPDNWKKIFQQLKEIANGTNRNDVQDVE